ncbi:kinase-like domain-containing protein [Gigaspora rosea]|uniref:Kinase-like domain-containing protein n=1 Tax=Gigaspora rosea TaxID=44941 RepID=A0A397UZM2_9GLOM|nr:kinase-like domain-containing protein [Gigaspora rosea]
MLKLNNFSTLASTAALLILAVLLPKDFITLNTKDCLVLITQALDDSFAITFIFEDLFSVVTFVHALVLEGLPSAVTSMAIFVPESLSFVALALVFAATRMLKDNNFARNLSTCKIISIFGAETAITCLMSDNFSSEVKIKMWKLCVPFKKLIQFQLTANCTAIMLTFISAVSSHNRELAIIAAQLIFVNLFAVALAVLALAINPPKPDLLNRKFRSQNLFPITFDMWKTIINQSIIQFVITLILLYECDNVPEKEIVIFSTFAISQIFIEMICRGFNRNIKTLICILTDKFCQSIFVIAVLQIFMVRFLRPSVQASLLYFIQWLICIGLNLMSMLVGISIRPSLSAISLASLITILEDNYMDSSTKDLLYSITEQDPKYSEILIKYLEKKKVKIYKFSQFSGFKEIGKGESAIVYETTFGKKKYALKFLNNNLYLHRDELRKIKRELRSLYRVDHPNIIKLHGISINPQSRNFILVLDYANNGTLRQYLQKKHKDDHYQISWNELIAIATKITNGLTYLHNKGIIHRDLHSKNILISDGDDGDKKILIADFGISKKISDPSTSSKSIFAIAYTDPWYLIREKERKRNQKSDIYSLGILLWELTSGIPPFQGLTMFELIVQFGKEKKTILDKVDGIPSGYIDLYNGCLSHEPRERPSLGEISFKFKELS